MLLLTVTPIKPLKLSEVCNPSHSLFSHLREYCLMIEKTIHGHIGAVIGPIELTTTPGPMTSLVQRLLPLSA